MDWRGAYPGPATGARPERPYPRRLARWRARIPWAALVVAILYGAFVDLETVPPLFWDEGWTLSAARHWVERGHYGQLLLGEPRQPGLAAALPVVAPIALAFRVFGVGVWQGRLAGVLLALSALGLMWYLARALYDRRVAAGTLGVLLVMCYPHPVMVGRQALGEMPALSYLLAGYVFLLLALRRSGWMLVPASLSWGLALTAKVQVAPFWAVSLLAAIVLALLRRWRRPAACLALGLGGSVLAAWLVGLLQGALAGGGALAMRPLPGIYEVTAAVGVPAVRRAALEATLAYGLPALLGLGYGAWRTWERPRSRAPDAAQAVLRLALLCLAGSWLVWFAGLAAAWVRYLVPPVFLASPFVAVLLRDLTAGVRLVGLAPVGSTGPARASRRPVLEVAGAVLAVGLVVMAGTRVAMEQFLVHRSQAGRAALHVVRFVNGHLPPGALIETYESELMFLLARRYHYPPDQVHVALIRRAFVDPRTPIDYDPLAANPDYLITGPFSRMWGLYDPVLASGLFRLLARFADYGVYARVREGR